MGVECSERERESDRFGGWFVRFGDMDDEGG